MTRLAQQLTRALLLAVVLVSVAGCIRMPMDGPVVEADAEGNTAVDQPPFIDPLPPQPDASPRDIVRGFLDAMTAFPTDLTVAREFLSDEARTAWNPQRKTITYAEASRPRGAAPRVTVTLSGGHELDQRGAWQGQLPDDESVLQFPVLRDADGQWRIIAAPDALIVPETWFEQRYRQVSLYFFDPAAKVLVPEPVFVPRGAQLATTLTAALLQGPGPGLADVSRSFIPPGLSFGVSVPVSADGVAELTLTGDAGAQTAETADLMMAQFAWTLRQEPSIRSLRVTIGGQPVRLAQSGSDVSVNHGRQYDPVGPTVTTEMFALRKGVLLGGQPEDLQRVSGPLGATAYGISQIAVSPDGSKVVAVSGDARSLLETAVRGQDEKVRQVLSTAGALLRPAWDVTGRVWVVERTTAGARVLYLQKDRVVQVDVPGVSGQQVGGFLVSRDGSRFVAVVRQADGQDALLVSRIQRDPQGQVLGLTPAQPIAWQGEERLLVRDLGWASPTTLVVLSVLTDDLSSVRTLSVDGAPAGQARLYTTVPGDVVALASTPVTGQGLYAVSEASMLDVSSPSRGTVVLPPGVSAISYAG